MTRRLTDEQIKYWKDVCLSKFGDLTSFNSKAVLDLILDREDDKAEIEKLRGEICGLNVALDEYSIKDTLVQKYNATVVRIASLEAQWQHFQMLAREEHDRQKARIEELEAALRAKETT